MDSHIKAETFARNWTRGSIFCYQRGCNCDGCYLKDLIRSSPCYMKLAVMKLVSKFGAPVERKDIIDDSSND